jgi:uncharacterized damage-inducible protein DinB
MKTIALSVLVLVASSVMSMGQAIDKPVEERRTITQVLDRSVTNMEKEFTSAAEAMPDTKYGFVPKEGEFKGVRTFGEQIRHVAAANYEFGAAILGEKPPVDIGGENGPESIKTKVDILKYLADSFTYVHKAVGSIDDRNVVELIKSPFGEGKVTRLGMSTLTVGHGFDHYGQMVVYLRMNGIVPPASRQ